MPNVKHLGTDYGGWVVDLDLIGEGSSVIDAGLGEDISFSLALQAEKGVSIIGVDPTTKSDRHISDIKPNNFKFINKAIAKHGTKEVKMYKNTNPNYVSESINVGHSMVGQEFHLTPCVSFKELLDENKNVSVVKMDIEGAEYDCLSECFGVPQICVEFHHFCINGISNEDTKKCISSLMDAGYEVLNANQQGTEFTFKLKSK